MTDHPDVLGIITTKYTDPAGTRIKYRARGIGPTYERFYRWLNIQQLVKQWDDWPWHGWEFADPNSDIAIQQNWSTYFRTPDADVISDQLEPVPEPPSAESMMFAEILQDAITEELNKEILADLAKMDVAASSRPPLDALKTKWVWVKTDE